MKPFTHKVTFKGVHGQKGHIGGQTFRPGQTFLIQGLPKGFESGELWEVENLEIEKVEVLKPEPKPKKKKKAKKTEPVDIIFDAEADKKKETDEIKPDKLEDK